MQHLQFLIQSLKLGLHKFFYAHLGTVLMQKGEKGTKMLVGKMFKKHFMTSVWSGQYPNTCQNIQHKGAKANIYSQADKHFSTETSLIDDGVGKKMFR